MTNEGATVGSWKIVPATPPGTLPMGTSWLHRLLIKPFRGCSMIALTLLVLGSAYSEAAGEIITILDSSAQPSGCTTQYRPVATDGYLAPFVLSGRTSINDADSTNPTASGEIGAIRFLASGTTVGSTSCGSDTSISGTTSDEEIIITFDSSVAASSVVIGLKNIDFNSDSPVLFFSSTNSVGYDFTVTTADFIEAFQFTQAGGGKLILGLLPNLPLGTYVDKIVLRETTGSVTIDSLSTAIPLAPPAANLDQVRNGSAMSPVDPGNWVNGNAGPSTAHYVEGWSIPYRVLMTELPTDGTVIELILGYDIKHSSANAIDYLTHFDRLELHTIFPHGVAELIDPRIDVPEVSGSPLLGDATFPIPMPNAVGSPVAGMPTDSFNALPASEQVMTLYNGAFANCAGESTSIVYTVDGNLNAALSETRIKVCFTASMGSSEAAETVVLSWGGHIALGFEWDPELSAGGINGSPYHMRLIDWNLNNLGNQDRSLSTEAINPCDFVTCDDGNACTVDTCDAGTGDCSFAPDPNIVCNDNGNFCDGAEICEPSTGLCLSTGTPCEAPNAVCCEGNDTCVAQCCDSLTCDDLNLCTSNACVSGSCAFTAVTCSDDLLFCNGDEVCNPSDGQCVSTGSPCSSPLGVCCEDADTCEAECCGDSDCNDNNLCTTDTCNLGICDNTPVDCTSNGLFCDGDEVCNPSDGLCISTGTPCGAPTAVCCEDADTCVADCCSHSDCNDGDLCTIDSCVNGACSTTPVTCTDNGQFCDGNEVCNPATGMCISEGTPCSTPTGVCCEGANTCVTDCCSDADCDDGDLCTTDSCSLTGACVFAPVTCTDNGLFCDGPETCDPVTGACVSGPVACADPLLCCEGTQTCATECCSTSECPNDGLFCTGSYSCEAGACINLGGPCATTEVCCETGQTCQAECCDDLDCPTNMVFCDGPEVCVAGVCGPAGDPCSAPLGLCCEGSTSCEAECCEDADCSDGLLCTTDSCMSGVCVFDPIICTDNGLFCDGPEACDPANGLCTSTGTPCSDPTGVCCEGADTCEAECCGDPDCNDNNLCTTDMCNLGVCVNSPVICIDNDVFCDGSEVCDLSNGMCVSTGTPCSDPTGLCCEGTDTCVTECCADQDCPDDGNECTDEVCSAGVCIHPPVMDGTVCNGAPVGDCDSQDTCQAGVCVDQITPSGTVCRLVAGDCDVEEFCDGVSKACPTDGFSDGTVACRPANGICDVAEFCTGGSADCPADGFAGTDVVCRQAINDCDMDEFCTGKGVECPADACQPSGTTCADDGNDCTNDVCDGACNCTHPIRGDGSPCGDQTPGGDCDEADICIAGICDTNRVDAGTVCRTAAGECDLEEVCDGAAVDCPFDDCKPQGTACSSDGNDCTADVCDGLCNCSHTALSDGSSCGNTIPTGECDQADVCVSGNCNSNPQIDGTSCGSPINSDCDNPDACLSGVCQDNLESSGTTCSSDGNDCTNDRCDGSGICDHTAVPNNTPCTDDGEFCTGTEACFAGQCMGSGDPCLGDDTCCLEDMDACGSGPQCVPTTSQWGLAIMALMLLVGARLRFRPRAIDSLRL